MRYVFAPNGVFKQIVLPGEVVEFSSSVKTTAKRLTADQKVSLGVSVMKMVSPPPFNPYTEKREEATPLFVGGEWVQKWSVSSIVPIDPEGLAEFITTFQQKLKDDTAAVRYAKETAGIVVNDMTVATDRLSQSMLNGAYTAVQINPAMLIDWKGLNGWTQLDKATVEALSQAVSAHVQACFTNEKNISVQINAGTTVADLVLVDPNSGWPV